MKNAGNTGANQHMQDALTRHRDSLKALLSRTVGEGVYFASQLAVTVGAIGAGLDIINEPNSPTLIGLAAVATGAVSAVLISKLRDTIKGLTTPITHHFDKISNERILHNFEDMEKSPNRAVFQQRLVDALLTKSDDARISELLYFLKRDNVSVNRKFTAMLSESIEERLAQSVSSLKRNSKTEPSVSDYADRLNALTRQIGLDPDLVKLSALKEITRLPEEAMPSLSNDALNRVLGTAFVHSLSGSPEELVASIKALRRELPRETFEHIIGAVASMTDAAQKDIEQAHANAAQRSLTQTRLTTPAP